MNQLTVNKLKEETKTLDLLNNIMLELRGFSYSALGRDGHVSRDSDTAIEIDINNSSLSTKNVNGCNSDYDGNGLSMEVYAIYPCLTVKVFIRMFYLFLFLF